MHCCIRGNKHFINHMIWPDFLCSPFPLQTCWRAWRRPSSVTGPWTRRSSLPCVTLWTASFSTKAWSALPIIPLAHLTPCKRRRWHPTRLQASLTSLTLHPFLTLQPFFPTVDHIRHSGLCPCKDRFFRDHIWYTQPAQLVSLSFNCTFYYLQLFSCF